MSQNPNNSMFNLNIERALLSTVLFEPEQLEELTLKVSASDFFLPFHRNLLQAMSELHNSNKPIDEEFLKTVLSKNKNYDEVALLDVLSANPISNSTPYIEELKKLRKRRELITLSIDIKKQIIEDNAEADDVIASASKNLEKIDDESLEVEHSIDQITKDFLQKMDEARELGRVKGIRTGIKELDALDVIFNPGDLAIIGARPSVGKTALATSMVANMIDDGHRVLFSSLDMDKNILLMRLVSTMSGETIADLKKGTVRDPKALHHALGKIREHLVIHNEKGIGWDKIKNKAKKLFRREKKEGRPVTVWFVDHIGKVKYKEPMFRRFEIGEVTSGMKAIGEEMGVVPIALTQLNRDSISRVENKPNLADLKESGAIEEDATHVILPHREAYHQKGKLEREPNVTDAELIVAKNQTGPTGIAKCKFHAKYTKFEDDNGYVVEYEYEDRGQAKADLPMI